MPQELVLENDAVLLRTLQSDDFTNLLPFALQEPDTWRFSLVSAAGEAGMQHYIDTAIKEREACYSYPFIVWDKKTGQYAGCTRFYDINSAFKTLQLGYTWYGERFRGTGLNKNCKFLLLQYAFETLGVERVEFRADNNNKKSVAAMVSIGCTIEGVLRSNMPNGEGQPGRRDSIILSILKNEWFGGVKEKLAIKIALVP